MISLGAMFLIDQLSFNYLVNGHLINIPVKFAYNGPIGIVEQIVVTNLHNSCTLHGFTSRVKNNVYPDQLASLKPIDWDI